MACSPIFNALRITASLATALLLATLVRAAPQLDMRDGHGHHHGAPLLELNETQVLEGHAPTPPSYWSVDVDVGGPNTHSGLMALHVVFMCLAFFVALPASIALRSVKHGMHGILVLSFYVLCMLGCAASAAYKKLTPNMYDGEAHSSQGWAVLCLALALTIVDAFNFFRRLMSFIRQGRSSWTYSIFWHLVVLGRIEEAQTGKPEYIGLVSEEPEEYEEVGTTAANNHSPPRAHYHIKLHTGLPAAHWTNDIHEPPTHSRNWSASSERTVFGDRPSPMRHHSDDTLNEVHERHLSPKVPVLQRITRGSFATLERILVFAGYSQVLMGIVVYTGGCRENYLNGCLAHLIKGSIFWCYGLVSFARFVGSFAELGWAWNLAPQQGYPSVEFVESFVIFFYGATNMWMERFGAAPGSPFTTKEIQHISIAVMFCFAGLLGMGIEHKGYRRWLSASAITSAEGNSNTGEALQEPPSYRASFNPFPSLAIGVTGAAMAAHAQTYLFQVQIHMLWGYLLLGFSLFRCLTYFFLWLGPPSSVMPSRPPTEALSTFFLACGGLMFMLSTEEVTFAAMRRGRDDMMFFLNVAIAITCVAFCWVLAVVVFKGWLRARKTQPTYPA